MRDLCKRRGDLCLHRPADYARSRPLIRLLPPLLTSVPPLPVGDLMVQLWARAEVRAAADQGYGRERDERARRAARRGAPHALRAYLVYLDQLRLCHSYVYYHASPLSLG